MFASCSSGSANSAKEMIFLRFCALVALALSNCSAEPVRTDTDSLLEMIKALQVRFAYVLTCTLLT